jgi:hypothetical protein
MLDSGPYASPPSEDWGLRCAKDWQLKLCWMPRICFLTGKPLWGKRAYRGIRWITGPGESIEEIFWVEKHEFIIWNLKRTQ